MAKNITVTDQKTGEVGNLAQEYVQNGADGKSSGYTIATHDNGIDTQGITAGAVDVLTPGLLNIPISEAITQMHFAKTPITNILQQLVSEKINSMRYEYAAVDETPMGGKVMKTVTLKEANCGREVPTEFELEVDEESLLYEGDEITFLGIPGYLPNGVLSKESWLTGCIETRKDATHFLVLLINGSDGRQGTTDGYVKEIPEGTRFEVIGTIASEGQATASPRATIPTIARQCMQKMLKTLQITNIYINSDKRINWTLDKVAAEQLRAFGETKERTYLFGKMGHFHSKSKQDMKYSMSGIFEQIEMAGSLVYELPKDGEIAYKDIIKATNATFIGNSGSQTRYLFCGSKFATAFWDLIDVNKNVHPADLNHAFGYNLQSINVSGHELLVYTHPLFDQLDYYSNYALILDMANISRKYFEELNTTNRDEKKTGAYDGQAIDIQEISSICLTYPQTHAIWKIKTA